MALIAYLAPHSWNLNTQLMFSLCPPYFVKMTFDPSLVATFLLLAPEVMETIWITTCEVLVEPGDLPSGSTKAFAKITSWADSPEMVGEKISRYLQSFNWHLIAVEDAQPFDENQDYDEEAAEMIERTKEDPNAIILGRFFSYKEN